MEYPAAHTEAGSLALALGPIKQLKHTAQKIIYILSIRVVVAFEKSAVLHQDLLPLARRFRQRFENEQCLNI